MFKQSPWLVVPLLGCLALGAGAIGRLDCDLKPYLWVSQVYTPNHCTILSVFLYSEEVQCSGRIVLMSSQSGEGKTADALCKWVRLGFISPFSLDSPSTEAVVLLCFSAHLVCTHLALPQGFWSRGRGPREAPCTRAPILPPAVCPSITGLTYWSPRFKHFPAETLAASLHLSWPPCFFSVQLGSL